MTQKTKEDGVAGVKCVEEIRSILEDADPDQQGGNQEAERGAQDAKCLQKGGGEIVYNFTRLIRAAQSFLVASQRLAIFYTNSQSTCLLPTGKDPPWYSSQY